MSKNSDLAEYILNNCTISMGVGITKIDYAQVFLFDVKQQLGLFDQEVIDFINLLHDLEIIDKIQRVAASELKEGELDDAYTFEVKLPELKDFIKRELENNSSFNPVASALIFKGQELKIPKDSKQFYFCKIMYRYPLNQAVSWDVIYGAMEEDLSDKINKDNWKIIYDTMVEVNKKAKDKLGIEQLFKYEKKEFIRII